MLVALVGVLYGWQHTFGRQHQQMTSPRVYATSAAQQTIIHLADGTRVTLAPQTTLTVGQDFNHHTRTVTLDGEALFDVSNHTGTPFIVRTGHLTTRVLGTQFDVRRYTQDRTTQVAVTEGKVMVEGIPLPATPSHVSKSSARMAMVLVAGTIGRVSDTTAVATAVSNITDYTRWTQGVLVFRRTPVPEVLATLEHWYGLTFRLADSTLATQHITATFDHRSIADVLATLRVLLNASMTFDSTNIVTVRTQHSRAGAAPARNTTEKFSSLHKEAGR
jgi:ferric-dicitrate binding protein FerR (iron transport regulator)